MREIRRRIRSVGNTRHITHAMEMVSASRLRQSERLFDQAFPFIEKMEALIRHFVESGVHVSHPFLARRDSGTLLVVLFTSDRGLCGAFNHHILEFAFRKLEKMRDRPVWLYFIGRRGLEYFKRFPQYDTPGAVLDLSGKANVEASERISNEVMELYLAGAVNEVMAIHYSSFSRIHSEPQMTGLLPIDVAGIMQRDEARALSGEKLHSTPVYIYEPGLEKALGTILPLYLRSRFYRIMLEQFICEHSARMTAMNSASKNCEDLREALTLKLNRARQSAITRELLDIVGGAEALR